MPIKSNKPLIAWSCEISLPTTTRSTAQNVAKWWRNIRNFSRLSHTTLWRSRDKLITFYLHYHNTYNYQYGYIQQEPSFHQVSDFDFSYTIRTQTSKTPTQLGFFFFVFCFFFVISEEDCLLSFIIRDEKQRREGEGEWYFMKCRNVTVTKS